MTRLFGLRPLAAGREIGHALAMRLVANQNERIIKDLRPRDRWGRFRKGGEA